MRVYEHRPPTALIYPEAIEPTIFLAGPIQGAPDWQAEALNLLEAAYHEGAYPGLRDLHVCNPRAPEPLSHSYEVQVAWEKAGLRRARQYGAILFWFAAKDDRLPYESGRAYAQTSRVEVGRVFGWRDYDDVQVLLGIDPAYQGGSARYLRAMADEVHPAFGPMKVHDSLQAVCSAAVEALRINPLGLVAPADELQRRV